MERGDFVTYTWCDIMGYDLHTGNMVYSPQKHGLGVYAERCGDWCRIVDHTGQLDDPHAGRWLLLADVQQDMLTMYDSNGIA